MLFKAPNVKLIVALAILVVFSAVLYLTLYAGETDQDHALHEREGETHHPEQSQNGKPDQSDEGDGSFSELDIPAITPPKSMVDQLIDKGMPITPPYRKKIIEQTALQTTEEVSKDIGNFFAIANSNGRNVSYYISDMIRWSTRLSTNMKTIRLIEEGRESPTQIKKLLEERIEESIARYATVAPERQKKLFQIQRGVLQNPSLSEDDGYYGVNFRYEDPIYEFGRLYDVVYGSFYALANINALDRKTEDLLRQWVNLEKPQHTDAREFDVWMINRHIVSSYTKDVSMQNRYRAIVGNTTISQETHAESAWDAIWSINDPMLAIGEIDTSDLETLEILSVPKTLNLSDDQIDGVVELFKASQ